MTNLVRYIRDFLHDEDATRWSDSRILYLINEGQKDLARRTKLIPDIYTFPLTGKLEVYDLPKDLIRLTRVEINGCKIPISSHDELDRDNCISCWHDKEGRPVVALKDHLSRDKIKFYPNPVNEAYELHRAVNKYGLVSSFPPFVVGIKRSDSKYGIVSYMDKNYGSGDVAITGRGGLSGVLGRYNYVVSIHYDRLPKELVSIDDFLEIDSVNEMAIKYYVCGHLLRQDKDSISRSLGKEELQLYEAEVKKLHSESAVDFTVGSRYDLNYRSVFNG